MRHITAGHMIGFNDELQKEAGKASELLRKAHSFVRSRAMKHMGMGARELRGQYGSRMMVGAGLGAAGGAVLADPDERGSRFRSAIKGGLIGGGLAGGTILATKKGREAATKGLSNFYERQKYSLTGKGLGDTERQKLKRAREIGLISEYNPKLHDMSTPKAAKAAKAAKERVKWDEEALRDNLLSAPGVAHGMLTHPIKTIKSGWKRGGALGKGFAALGAYETGRGLIDKPEPGGPGRMEKSLRGAGNAVGWLVAPTTLLGGQIVGMGGGELGGHVGRYGDKAVSAAAQKIRGPGQIDPRGGY